MNILFIVTGSIAAPKCYEIFNILTKKGIKIDCLLTDNGKKLVNLSKIKKNILGKVYINKNEENDKMLHINLSRNNDIVVVCPATANSIAKFANGYGDNLASTTLLASNKPIILIPAMNTMMWNNKINQKNIKFLKLIGVEFIGPKTGKLKCGEFGLGRIEDTRKIINNLITRFNDVKDFANTKCLITAGPTIEEIDPVRFISNYSSGKQGYEIANLLAERGAKVILISGPTNIPPPLNVKFIKVKTAKEMFDQVNKNNKKIELAIFSAAVADFRINRKSQKKIKKNNFMSLELKKNTDILENISKTKNRPKFVVGFAAETGGLIKAKRKLKEKNCDMLVYNQIKKNNKIFGLDQNEITIITKNKNFKYPKTSKINCAKNILNLVKFGLNK